MLFYRSNKSKNLHSDGQTDDDEVSKKRKKKFVASAQKNLLIFSLYM